MLHVHVNYFRDRCPTVKLQIQSMQQLHQHDTVWFEWHTGSLAIGFKFPTAKDRDALLMSVRVYQSQPDDTAVYWIRHTPTESQHNQSQLYVSLQDTTFYDQSPFQIIVVQFLVLTFDKAGLDLYLRSYGLISFFRYLTIPYICCLVSRAGKTLWMSAFQASRRLLNISGSTVQREPSLISRIRVGDQFDYLMREAVRSLDNKHLEQEICFRYWNVLSLTCQLFSG